MAYPCDSRPTKVSIAARAPLKAWEFLGLFAAASRGSSCGELWGGRSVVPRRVGRCRPARNFTRFDRAQHREVMALPMLPGSTLEPHEREEACGRGGGGAR